MSTNPINPEALREYAASRNDMDALRPEERSFLDACAFQWQSLINHDALDARSEAGKPATETDDERDEHIMVKLVALQQRDAARASLATAERELAEARQDLRAFEAESERDVTALRAELALLRGKVSP